MIASGFGRATATLWTLLAVALLAALASCDKSPLTAPTESTVTIFVNANTVPLNGSADVTASVLEKPGTAVHDGTTVTFTSSLGRLDPPEAQTKGGKATVRFLAGSISGTAKIGAFSGAAKATEIELKVGGAAAAHLSLSASPATLPSIGGEVEVLAIVTDDSGNRLPFVPVSFSTTAGELTATSVNTDGNGEARVKLTSTKAADVTARAGSAESKVSITLNAPLVITITPPASLQENTPVSFTIGVTAPSGSVVREVSVDWDDESPDTSLGALTGSTSVGHTFVQAGSYRVTVTATDTNGEETSASTSVTVVPVQVSVTITGPTTVRVGSQVTFTVTVTPATLQVRGYRFNPGDGQKVTENTETATTTTFTVEYKTIGQFVAEVTVFTPSADYKKQTVVTVVAGTP
jgi:hypothetical protein